MWWFVFSPFVPLTIRHISFSMSAKAAMREGCLALPLEVSLSQVQWKGDITGTRFFFSFSRAYHFLREEFHKDFASQFIGIVLVTKSLIQLE